MKSITHNLLRLPADMYHFCVDALLDILPSVTRKQQSLLKRNIGRRLIREFDGDDGQLIGGQQYFIGFGLLHYSLIRICKPSRVLCIGSRRGFVPAVCALACKDNRRGHVDFVDAGYGPETPGKSWSGTGFWQKTDATGHFSRLGVTDRIKTYVMTSKEYGMKNKHTSYQYIYIDGDHSFEGVTKDFRLFWPKLDRGGFMAFHDVVARGYLDKGKFGVWKFWKQLDSSAKIIFPFPKDSGLGIIQKP